MDARARRIFWRVSVLAVIGALTTAALRTGDAADAQPAAIEPLEADSFPQQWAYETTLTRFNGVCCSRQCGKTTGARRRARRVTAQPRKRVLYLTLIKDNARDLFWRPLLQELDDAGIPYNADQTRMELFFPNGSLIKARGCEDLRGVGKLRGGNWDLIIVDEAQEPKDDVLQALVDQVIVPQMATRGGAVDLLGTPPEVIAGYFVDALKNPAVWTRFGWTMYDNRFIPHERIEALIGERGLTPDNPIYKREFLGLLETDPSKLAYEYQPERNDYDPSTVEFKGDQWRNALGLDLGFQDRDAIVVVGWRKDDPDRRLYERHTWQENHQDVDQLSVVLRQVIADYRPVAIVGDHGGHGAVKVLETLKNRLHVAMQLKPTDVMVSVGLVNDDLRTGRLLLRAGGELGGDLVRVQRTVNPTTKRVEINKKGYHSDLSEALRYAHHGARHFAAKPPKPEPDIHQRRELAWQSRKRQEEDPWR